MANTKGPDDLTDSNGKQCSTWRNSYSNSGGELGGLSEIDAKTIYESPDCGAAAGELLLRSARGNMLQKDHQAVSQSDAADWWSAIQAKMQNNQNFGMRCASAYYPSNVVRTKDGHLT